MDFTGELMDNSLTWISMEAKLNTRETISQIAQEKKYVIKYSYSKSDNKYICERNAADAFVQGQDVSTFFTIRNLLLAAFVELVLLRLLSLWFKKSF